MNDLEKEWRQGYAIQALADMAVYELLVRRTDLPACHRLHYLQMCLEKTAKAYLWQSKMRSERSAKISTSHKFIEKIIPQLFRNYWMLRRKKGPPPSRLLKKIKQLCQELDFLAPATDDAGQRPDNCEYPWRADDAKGTPHVVVPARFAFPILEVLKWTEAAMLIKSVLVVLPTLAS